MVAFESKSSPDTKLSQHGLRPALLLVSLSLYWYICGLVLWWSYDITPLIRGGYYQREQALGLVARMGLIVTAVTSIAWLLVRPRKSTRPPWRMAWTAAWLTFLVLFIYAAGVVALPVDKAVLPVLGDVNSRFFSEVGPIVFLLYVIPTMTCVSGLLYYVQVQVIRACTGLT